MKGETGERWRKLCEPAAVEQDSDRLLELVREIDQMLSEKQQRLRDNKTIELPNADSDDHAA